MSTAERTGACQCGKVRYSIRGGASRLNICHCRDCQRQSGSAFGMSLIIEPTAFRLEAGQLKEFQTTADSGRRKTCAFCPDCGVRIYNATSALMAVKAGTLDDTSQLEPHAHYWTISRQPWTVLPDGIPCFRESS
jgi:hypothetical protein